MNSITHLIKAFMKQSSMVRVVGLGQGKSSIKDQEHNKATVKARQKTEL
jgi:hypothetical protein